MAGHLAQDGIMPGMRVSDLGEIRLVERIAGLVAERQLSRRVGSEGRSLDLLVGIGDDAAAWQTQDTTQVLTADALVEGVHFRRDMASWEEVGWKALAVNLSDVAAMGASPGLATVMLGLPLDLEVAAVDGLYRGMLDCSARHGGAVVGGDVVRSPVLFIALSLTGTAERLLTRSSARPGHAVAVTGTLGGSAAGLEVLRQGLCPGEGDALALRSAHLRPQPRLQEGQLLAKRGVPCAMDISDGLVADLGRVCRVSGVGAVVESASLPIHPAAKRLYPQQSLALALGGGEDYELLFAGPPELVEDVLSALSSGGAVVGRIVEDASSQVVVLDEHSRPLDAASYGWDHLRP